MSEPGGHTQRFGSKRLGLVIAGSFCVGNLVFLNGSWLLDDNYRMVLLGVAMAQTALASVWAASSRVVLLARFAIPVFVLLVSWRFIGHLLAIPVSSAGRVWFMATLVWVSGTSFLFVHWQERRSLRVGLQSMMMWTLVAGLAFAWIQYGRNHWEWSWVDLQDSEMILLNSVGVLLAVSLVSTLWLASATNPRAALIRGWIALGVMNLSCWIFCETGRAATNRTGDFGEIIPLFITVNGIVLVTLAVIRRWGFNTQVSGIKHEVE